MEFVSVKKELYGAVISMLRESFFSDEPLNKAVELCAPGQPHPALEALVTATMAEGFSIAALEKGQVRGVALNGILRPGDSDRALQELKKSTDEGYKKIFSVLYTVAKELDLFKRYNVDRIFEARIVAVSEKARGRGLAKTLMQRSIDIAKENEFKLVKTDATSAFTQRVCTGLGMEVIYRISYDDFRDSKGELVFNVEHPHLELAVMVLQLSKK